MRTQCGAGVREVTEDAAWLGREVTRDEVISLVLSDGRGIVVPDWVVQNGAVPRSDWTELRFIPNPLTLPLGVPGASVRVVRVSPEGWQEEVDHRLNIEVADPTIVEVAWTASGLVCRPKKVGHTEATASLGGLTTLPPLQISVVDELVDDTDVRLEVRPNPARLGVGKTSELGRVQLLPGHGALPVDVDYRLQSSDERIVTVEGDRILRGRSAGRALVTVTPLGVAPKYAGVRAEVTIDVEQPVGETRLVLIGPSQSTVRALVNFRVELTEGSLSRDVTNDGAVLVLDPDEQARAKVLPGCTLTAEMPGRIHVRARYKELISNVVQLGIDPVAAAFERLEVEVDSRMLYERETRSYQVWGYPLGGGRRQDLTSQVVGKTVSSSSDGSRPQVTLTVSEPAGGDIVDHNPPEIVAKSPGRFQLVATLAPDLRSDVVDLEIIPKPSGDDELRVSPSSITVRVGERTPAIRAEARSRTGRMSRDVAAEWSARMKGCWPWIRNCPADSSANPPARHGSK